MLRPSWNLPKLLPLLAVCACSGGGRAEAPGLLAGDASAAGPPINWSALATPESVGMDSCRVEQGLAFIRSQDLPIHGLLVVREGSVVVEAYHSPHHAGTLFDMQSITKSIVSGLVGVAIAEGRLDGVASRVLDYFPQTTVGQPSAEKSAIRIEDLLTLRSGLAYDNDHESFTAEPDSVAFILGHGMRAAPGSLWSYSSADVHLLSALLQGRIGSTTEEYAMEKIFRPLAIAPGAWLKDGSGITVGGFGLGLTLRDLGKIGQLYLNRGTWDGRQVIPAAWVDASVIARADTPWTRGAMGYLWWIWENTGFRAGGRYGQQVAVFPSERLVVAYTAQLPLEAADTILDKITTDYILEALRAPSSNAAPCVLSQKLDGATGADGGISCANRGTQRLADTDIRLTSDNEIMAIGDGSTTFCSSSSETGKLCIRGRAADAGSDYMNWGAALVVRLPPTNTDGGIGSGFDARSLGIAGVRFTVSGTGTLPAGLRVGVVQVDQGGLAYQNNPFLAGGGTTGLKADGNVVQMFQTMSQPSWSKLPAGTPLDSSQLYSLRFQIPASPGVTFDYDVCISDLAWVDANGEVISTK